MRRHTSTNSRAGRWRAATIGIGIGIVCLAGTGGPAGAVGSDTGAGDGGVAAVTGARITCSGWNISFVDFPADQNITFHVAVDGPGHSATYDRDSDQRTVGTVGNSDDFTGTGTVDLVATWNLNGPQHFETSKPLDCPTSPPTTTPTTPPLTSHPATSVLPAVASSCPTISKQCSDPARTLPFTGANTSWLAAIGTACLALGYGLLRASRRHQTHTC